MRKTITKTFALPPANGQKLSSMARELGVAPNRIVNMLIENASIGEVVKREPVAVLPLKKNSAHGVVTTTSAVTSVR